MLLNIILSDVKIVSHPVHIIDNDNSLSPSSLIPFCEFGGSKSTMGVKIEQFDLPVCNSFQAKIFNDQVCYEVDLNNHENIDNIERELKFGFNFIMDYNEDRQVDLDLRKNERREVTLVNSLIQSDDNKHAYIYFDSIGKNIIFIMIMYVYLVKE